MGAALLIQKYSNIDYRYGVIAVPELTGWQPLTTADRYLMVATDGIFESLTANDVRDLILEWNSHDIQGSIPFSQSKNFIGNILGDIVILILL